MGGYREMPNHFCINWQNLLLGELCWLAHALIYRSFGRVQKVTLKTCQNELIIEIGMWCPNRTFYMRLAEYTI